MKNKWVCIWSAVIIFIIGTPDHAYTQSAYNKFQALYIYSFAKYISWEKDTTSFVIGVIGEGAIKESSVIDELITGAQERKIGGVPVEIKQLNNLSEARYCHIIYLPKYYAKILPHLLTALQGRPALVVSEEDLAEQGAGISFFVEDNRLRFKINLKVLEALGLKVSKGLLDLAVKI